MWLCPLEEEKKQTEHLAILCLKCQLRDPFLVYNMYRYSRDYVQDWCLYRSTALQIFSINCTLDCAILLKYVVKMWSYSWYILSFTARSSPWGTCLPAHWTTTAFRQHRFLFQNFFLGLIFQFYITYTQGWVLIKGKSYLVVVVVHLRQASMLF